MTFDDPKLVERIESGVQEMFVSHIMIARGASKDVLSSATFFTSAFEFTWDDVRKQPSLTMKSSFAANADIFKVVRGVLPDLFCSSRPAIHRARWKDLWKSKPTSVPALEQAVAKLAEQAFWALAADPDCAVASADPLPAILSEGWDSDTGVQSPKTPSRKSPKARKNLAQDQKSAKNKGIELILKKAQKGAAASGNPGHGADEQAGKDDSVRADATEMHDIFDDACSTCSGASSFCPQSVDSTPLSAASWPVTRTSADLQDMTALDQKSCYVWGESGQWFRQCAPQPAAYLGHCAVVKNTFLDFEARAESSNCKRARSLPPRLDASRCDQQNDVVH